MARSPIEQMVDRACGVTADDLSRPAPAPHVVTDDEVRAVTNACMALVRWRKADRREKARPAHFDKLAAWADALIDQGW